MPETPSPQTDLVEKWLARLQENGYRLTEPRRVVVETVANSRYLLNPFDVFERARQHYPRLGLVTVYRTLEKLEELNLVQRVHRPSGCQAFITAFSGHQHLLICERCGRAAFFSGEGERIEALIDTVTSENGFRVQSHWLQLFGICEACQEEAA